jgi:RimJ/RimL family protein N-acetyltransferase
MQLQTGRLLLRDFTPEDVAAVQVLDSDPELARYRGGRPATEDDTRAFIARTQQWLQEQPRPIYAFAIMLLAPERMIGVIGLILSPPDLGAAELWYRLSREHWKQGYTTEAAACVLSFGFTDLRLHRIFALCQPDNAGSWRVMEKIGMRYEGRLREDFPNSDGTWRDRVLYAILQHERS